MIVYIEGILREATPLQAVIDCGGLGYLVHIPVTTAEKLPKIGQKTLLHTVAIYREDSQSLYGFASKDERDLFLLLTEKVSGIGPKSAISILSKLSLQVLSDAIGRNDIALLSKCPGIGKKTAERICVELKDKLAPVFAHGDTHLTAGPTGADPSAGAQTAGSTLIQDAVAALITLGYKLDVADKAVRQAHAKLGPEASTQELIRAALK